MRTFKRCAAIILAAAMVITAAPSNSATAAKKPKLSKKKVSIKVGETVKIKVKNAKKTTKVTWKATGKKKIVKLSKKIKKGKKASVKVTGVGEGKATVNAIYKVGKKKKTLKCTVTVAAATPAVDNTTAPTQGTSAAPATEAPAPSSPATPKVTPTPRPTRTPTAVPTPSPTPLAIEKEYNFQKVTNGIAFDVAAYESISGTGAYDSKLGGVAINDTSATDVSQGTWTLPANAPTINLGDVVTFRVQGYNYGTSGFRFWIGTGMSGCCTPILLSNEIDESLAVGEYPQVITDADGNSVTMNQMALNVDPETKAFDVTFSFKAGTSQNDTDGACPNFTIKYIMDGDTAGYINGLVIKDIYYINEGGAPIATKEPVPTGDPNVPGVDLSGTVPLYGAGSVAVNADGSVTGTDVNGLLVPIGTQIPEGKKVNVTVYGQADVGARFWLSDSANKRWSDIVNPMSFAQTYTLTATNLEEAEGTYADHIQIKGTSHDTVFSSITINKVVVVDPDAVPTQAPATEAPATEAPATATPEPTITETLEEVVDLSDAASYEVDGSATVAYNEDTEALDATFPWGTGIVIAAPTDDEFNKVEVTYTSNGLLNVYLFDSKFTDGIGIDAAGQHEVTPKISESAEDNTITWEYTADVVKGIKFVSLDGTTNINFKSVKFIGAEIPVVATEAPATEEPEATEAPATEEPETPVANLAINGDFSDGITGWGSNYNYTPTAADGYGVYTGRWNCYSGATYVINRRFAEGDVVDFAFDVKLLADYEENANHSFAFWFKSSDGVEGTKYQCLDAEGNVVYGNSETWTTVKGSYTVPEYTESLTIYIAEGPGYNAERNGDFCVDNLYISTENEEPPVATAAPATEAPDRDPADVVLDVDSIIIVGGEEGAEVTIDADGSASYELEAGFSGMILPIPSQYILNNGDSFVINIDYESTGCDARVYLLSGTADSAKSNIIGPASSPLGGIMTATTNNVDHIFVKASAHNTKFTSLKINSITISDVAPATEAPATEEPEATEAPATEAPATEVPATEVPATATPEPTEVPATSTPEPTEVPAVNLAVNGDFSDGKTGWSTNYVNDSLTVSEDGYGVAAGRWNNYSGVKYVIDRRFAEGDVIEFSYDIKLAEDYAENGNLSFTYNFSRSDGKESGHLIGNDADGNRVYGSADEWTTVVGTYTIPAYTDNLTILICEGPGYGETRNGVFYIDNLVITTENEEPAAPTPRPDNLVVAEFDLSDIASIPSANGTPTLAFDSEAGILNCEFDNLEGIFLYGPSARTYERIESVSEIQDGDKILMISNNNESKGTELMRPEGIEINNRIGFALTNLGSLSMDPAIAGDYEAQEWTFTKSGDKWLVGTEDGNIKLASVEGKSITATLDSEGDELTIGGSADEFTFAADSGYVLNRNGSRDLINGYADKPAKFYLYRYSGESTFTEVELTYKSTADLGMFVLDSTSNGEQNDPGAHEIAGGLAASADYTTVTYSLDDAELKGLKIFNFGGGMTLDIKSLKFMAYTEE